MLALLLIAQLAAVPPGEPPTQLKFVHVDGTAASYIDDAFTRPDEDRPGAIRTRILRVPFDTRLEPYWLTQRHDCEGRRSQPLWRESAIELMYEGRRDIPGGLSDWDAHSQAVGQAACGAAEIRTPAPAPLTPDEAMMQAYRLPLDVRFQPELYATTGDLGETLDFLGLDHAEIGWFVEPRSVQPDGESAIIDALAINGRAPADGERFVWFRLRFDCRDQMLTLGGHRYAEGPRPLAPVMLEATAISIAPLSMMARIQQYACTPDDPPDLQAVPGLRSAIAGIVGHVTAQDAVPGAIPDAGAPD